MQIQAQSSSPVCQALFGRDFNALTVDERAELRRVIRKAGHYKDHARITKLNRDRARQKKLKIIEALSIPAECQRCGYCKYVGALEFHHRDPTIKESGVLLLPLLQAIEEARKCDLICANCHREVHDETPSTHQVGRPREDDPLLDKYLELQR